MNIAILKGQNGKLTLEVVNATKVKAKEWYEETHYRLDDNSIVLQDNIGQILKDGSILRGSKFVLFETSLASVIVTLANTLKNLESKAQQLKSDGILVDDELKEKLEMLNRYKEELNRIDDEM